MVKISASILKADFTQLGKVVKELESAKSDYIHLDVMDGCFVDTITFGPKMVEDIKKITRLPLDVHLMITNPKKHIESFVKAGADNITIHQEAADNLAECLNIIKSQGIKASVSIRPDTDIMTIASVLPMADMILVMTVEPGMGGQELIAETLDKVREMKKMKTQNGYKYDIEVDGGINMKTKDAAIEAGANVLVVGSAITDTKDYKKAIKELKGI
ncbi:MAG: ribulose-phosphate 3-epimerase [Eubacteriales bacterium]